MGKTDVGILGSSFWEGTRSWSAGDHGWLTRKISTLAPLTTTHVGAAQVGFGSGGSGGGGGGSGV